MRQRKNTRTMSETNNQAFGKFESLGAFLESYKAAEKKSFKKTLKDMTVAESATAMKKQRSVVEVNATIAVKEPDDTDAAGGKHIRMQIQLTKIVQNDAAVSADVKDALAKKRNIFVAVRFGDSLGIQENIPGLKNGATLHLRGEWIPADKAFAHGGAKLSVLHFTHHPLGFICTVVKCFN